jgi:hypothetical protein
MIKASCISLKYDFIFIQAKQLTQAASGARSFHFACETHHNIAPLHRSGGASLRAQAAV